MLHLSHSVSDAKEKLNQTLYGARYKFSLYTGLTSLTSHSASHASFFLENYLLPVYWFNFSCLDGLKTNGVKSVNQKSTVI